MKNSVIPATAIALLSAMSLSGARAASFYTEVQSQAASLYTQIDCMARDGDSTGCWRVGRDYGPYSGNILGRGGIYRSPDQFSANLLFRNNSGGSIGADGGSAAFFDGH